MSSVAVAFKKQSLEALVLYLQSSVVYLTLWHSADIMTTADILSTQINGSFRITIINPTNSQ